jgi:hypothetical protein
MAFINQNTLKLQNNLSSDRQVVKINDDSSGLLLKDNRVFVEEQPTEENEVATKKYVDDNDFPGKIIGFTRLEGDLTNQSTFEIQNSMTVEDDTHKITFITPSTGSVEIEATFLINASSTDTRISIGLSDSDSYNAVANELEYDGVGISFGDDEVDDHVKTAKFVLKNTQLAATGSSNTFWIGFSTTNATKTAYLGYGYRATHGICDHPFIIKATVLPSTIYDGQ